MKAMQEGLRRHSDFLVLQEPKQIIYKYDKYDKYKYKYFNKQNSAVHDNLKVWVNIS